MDVLSDFIESVEAINQGQRAEVAELAVEQLGGDVTGRKICVLGAAFKPGTDDTRNSPAMTVARFLVQHGADVHLYDPQARVADEPGITQEKTITEAMQDAELVLHLTEWPEFRQLEPEDFNGLVKNKILIDGRLKLHRPTWVRAGWKVVQMGRASTL